MFYIGKIRDILIKYFHAFILSCIAVFLMFLSEYMNVAHKVKIRYYFIKDIDFDDRFSPLFEMLEDFPKDNFKAKDIVKDGGLCEREKS